VRRSPRCLLNLCRALSLAGWKVLNLFLTLPLPPGIKCLILYYRHLLPLRSHPVGLRFSRAISPLMSSSPVFICPDTFPMVESRRFDPKKQRATAPNAGLVGLVLKFSPSVRGDFVPLAFLAARSARSTSYDNSPRARTGHDSRPFASCGRR